MKDGKLPFSRWWPLAVGGITGIVLRLVFISPPGSGGLAAMSGAFIFLVPLAVGAVTVYAAERQERRSWNYYVWAPMIAVALFVAGTMVAMIEGVICAVIALPLFCALGAVGGLIMGAICRVTRWPRHAAYGFVLLPLAVGVMPPQGPDVDHVACVERTRVIDAPAEAIWREIANAGGIRADEVDRAWIYRIGVPLPISGVVEPTASGRVRKVTMGKQVHFDQVVTHWDENRHVRFAYRFDADSFPPGALDDHVRIGGHYFDLTDTAYTLSPQTETSTRLEIRICYRVTTDFNWYAGRVAQFLVGNFEDVILDFYRDRATARN